MLRALDPENNYAPKSEHFEPTKDELKRFSKGELESIAAMKSDDEEWRLSRAARDAQARALLKLAESIGAPSQGGASLSRRT